MKFLFIFYCIFSALVIVGAWEFDPKRKWYSKVLGAVLSIWAAPVLFPILVGMYIKDNLSE
jgi:hypothetical protein